jgi:hypothetical protein
MALYSKAVFWGRDSFVYDTSINFAQVWIFVLFQNLFEELSLLEDFKFIWGIVEVRVLEYLSPKIVQSVRKLLLGCSHLLLIWVFNELGRSWVEFILVLIRTLILCHSIWILRARMTLVKMSVQMVGSLMVRLMNSTFSVLGYSTRSNDLLLLLTS